MKKVLLIVIVLFVPCAVMAQAQQLPPAALAAAQNPIRVMPQAGQDPKEAAVPVFSQASGLTEDEVKAFFDFVVEETKPSGLVVLKAVPKNQPSSGNQAIPPHPITLNPDDPTIAREDLGYIEGMGFFLLTTGGMSFPLPGHGHPGIWLWDIGYILVDEGEAHVLQFNMGFWDTHQLVGLSYGYGIGPRNGWGHFVFKFSAAYIHSWIKDEDEHQHALNVAFEPTLIGNFGALWDPLRAFEFFIGMGFHFHPLTEGGWEPRFGMRVGAGYSWD